MKDQLLENIMLYWVTGTINSAMRMYYESIGPGRMPKTLHWFKYAALLTWVSGVDYLVGGVRQLSGRGDFARVDGVTRDEAAADLADSRTRDFFAEHLRG